MADNIGTAYVQIEPSFDGVTPKIESHFSGEGEKGGKSFASGFGSVMGTVGKVMTGAVAAAGTAVAGLTKQAVSSFSEFEQLQGGAELLFGSAYGKVITNANHAFAEVQMSVNDYLKTANGYATGLKQALGGDEMAAADLTNKIITAQADIVAATGNTAESVSNAFAGVMKNNFNMLDNLSLGIKPTKEGMQEVIDKMNEWNAEQGHATKYQMDNLADMQAALVDYVSYVGMSGYAHEEAAGTIQGSLAQAKASWENLLMSIGVGDMDTMSTAIDNLVESVSTVGNNLQPVIEKALKGISILISELAPEIAAALPDLVTQVLPGLLTAGVSIIESLGQGILAAIPSLMPTISQVVIQLADLLVSMLPQLLSVGISIIQELATGITQALPTLLPTIVSVVSDLAQLLIDNVPLLLDTGIQLLLGIADGLVQGIPQLVEKIPDIIDGAVNALITGLPLLIDGAVQLVTMLAENLPTIITSLVDALPSVLSSIVDGLMVALPLLIDGCIQLVTALVPHLPEIIMALINAIPEIIMAIVTAFSPIVESLGEVFSNAWESIKESFSGVGEWFSEKVETIKGFFSGIGDKASETWNDMLSNPILQAFLDFISESFTALKETLSAVWDNIKEAASAAWDLIKNAVMGPVLLLIDLVTGDFESLKTDAENIWNNIKDAASRIWNSLSDAVTEIVVNFRQKIETAILTLKSKLAEIWENVKTAAISMWTNIKTKVVETVKNLIEGVKQTIRELPGIIKEKLNEAIDFIKSLPSQALEWGKDLISGFIDGIKQKLSDLKGSLSDVAGSIRDYLHFSEPDVGPLKDFHTYAPDMMDLFAQGIRDNASTVEKALTDATSGMMSTNLDVNTAQSIQTSAATAGMSSGDERMSRIETLMHEVIEKLQIPIVMDTGALVGATAGAYNVALGQIATRGGRR